jgi:hypothetical protein
LVVWADSQPQQGPLHTNFALSKSGEAIGLFDTDANLNQVIDSFAFGPQDDDVTFGRLPDGAPGIVRLPRRTMGSSNNVILLGTTWWAE